MPSQEKTEWLVFVEIDYYPYARIVSAVSGEEAIKVVASEQGEDFDLSKDLSGNRALVIAVPFSGHVTNRVNEENSWRWGDLRSS